MEFNDWCHSMAVSLRSVDFDGYHQSSSISLVPEVLKKSNKDAYIPKVVSIGPRFKGSREDLLLMEDIKIRCLKYLFHRVKQHVNAYERLMTSCCEAIWNLNDQIRASYVVDINLEQHELAKIMLEDGCFLLELLISKEFDAQLPSTSISPSPANEVLRDEDVLSDLTLLENQIPICVLHKLSQTLFGNLFGNDLNERATRINNLVLSVLGYSQLEVQSIESPHILDIVHFFVNGKILNQSKTESLLLSQSIHSGQDTHVVDIMDTQTQQQLKLKRCALRLLFSGVTIKLPKDKDNGFEHSYLSLVWNCFCGMLFWFGNILLHVNDKHLDLNHTSQDVEVKVKGLDFYFKFQKRKLEISQLHITKTTKAKWCNLIAWEHHKKYKDFSHFARVPGGKFTWAALIFNGLICCADDVQLLKDKKIIVDHLKMNNQELMKFFRTIAIGIDHGVVDSSSYIQMVHDMNNYTDAFFIEQIWRTAWNTFIYHRHDWLLKFMNRNYNFVATLLSVLAVVQTVFAILTYCFSK